MHSVGKKAQKFIASSLIYPDDVKPRLLNYIYTTLLFSDANVDFNIVTWNRYVNRGRKALL